MHDVLFAQKTTITTVRPACHYTIKSEVRWFRKNATAFHSHLKYKQHDSMDVDLFVKPGMVFARDTSMG